MSFLLLIRINPLILWQTGREFFWYPLVSNQEPGGRKGFGEESFLVERAWMDSEWRVFTVLFLTNWTFSFPFIPPFHSFLHSLSFFPSLITILSIHFHSQSLSSPLSLLWIILTTNLRSLVGVQQATLWMREEFEREGKYKMRKNWEFVVIPTVVDLNYSFPLYQLLLSVVSSCINFFSLSPLCDCMFPMYISNDLNLIHFLDSFIWSLPPVIMILLLLPVEQTNRGSFSIRTPFKLVTSNLTLSSPSASCQMSEREKTREKEETENGKEIETEKREREKKKCSR